jgi:C-terminal processing protease CtpA/Prc
VRSPIAGGPSARAGVKAGDVVSEIDDVPTQGLAIDPVIAKLRGSAGAPVRLKIARKDQDKPIDVTIVREVIRAAGAQIEVKVVDDELVVTAVGPWPVFDFEKGKPTVVKIAANGEFRNPGGDNGRLGFLGDATGKITGVVLNPGPEQIEARKID